MLQKKLPVKNQIASSQYHVIILRSNGQVIHNKCNLLLLKSQVKNNKKENEKLKLQHYYQQVVGRSKVNNKETLQKLCTFYSCEESYLQIYCNQTILLYYLKGQWFILG